MLSNAYAIALVYLVVCIVYFSNMDLLSDSQLNHSAIVANNRMNRERNANGVNSYEKDIGVDPIFFIEEKLKSQTTVHWFDLCCGKARALIQTAIHFKNNPNVFLTGIDLVGMYDAVPDGLSRLSLYTTAFAEWNTEQKFDLITSVHGIHYLGDKLAAISKAVSMLTDQGLFIANFDVTSLKGENDVNISRKMETELKRANMSYYHKTKILKTTGPKHLSIKAEYIGADDKAGPNYTGQEAVNSYYTLIF